MRILSLFLALLIACSPVEPTDVPSPDLALADLAGQPQNDLAVVTGPTRIVQRTWTGSDGVVVKLPDLYDTVEKIACFPLKASDGIVRCLPTNGGIFYQDAACTVPVSHVSIGCVPDKYYRVGIVNQCGVASTVNVFRTGGRTSLTKLYLGSTCLDVSSQIPSYDFYALSPVPPSTFAAGAFNY